MQNEIDTKEKNNEKKDALIDQSKFKDGDPDLKVKVVEALETCYDPEIPVNIYELGLIYDIDVDQDKKVDIKMTLTSPACPVAEVLPVEVENKIKAVQGVRDAKVEIVWEPQWVPDMMSEVAKFELGML